VRECDNDLLQNVSMSISCKPKATVHNFILGQDDPHFSMFFVNKVMGPHLNSDKEDVVNKDDNCIQHSAFGKEWNSLFFTIFNVSFDTLLFPFYAGPDKFVSTCLITNKNHQKVHPPTITARVGFKEYYVTYDNDGCRFVKNKFKAARKKASWRWSNVSFGQEVFLDPLP